MKLFSKDTLKPFDWALIIGVIISNFIYTLSYIGEEETNIINELIGSIACITGVVCVVLVAKRSISNYIFGVINVSLYAYISYKSSLFGDFALNAFYYLPMQFIGWFFWIKERGVVSKNGKVDTTLVKSHKMTSFGRVILLLACIISTLFVGYLLSIYTTDPQPYKDSSTTVLSIIAMVLLAKKYMEQWYLWGIVNIISIIMWTYMWINGDSNALLMVIMFIFYLANSINGIIVWSKGATLSQNVSK